MSTSLNIVHIRDGPNAELWHSAEAEGLGMGRLTKRMFYARIKQRPSLVSAQSGQKML